MNPNFALILNYKVDNSDFDPDFLVKTARNIGARAVSGDPSLKAACQKYTIAYLDQVKGQTLTAQTAINTIVENRKDQQATIIDLPVHNGNFDEKSKQLLETINNWMHMFGHALNESTKSLLSVDQEGFVLENRYAPYQKYVFLKKPLANEITISGLEKEPNRVEWIENRIDLKFNYHDGKLKIALTEPDQQFEWEVLRIQAHRSEDDLEETKF